MLNKYSVLALIGAVDAAASPVPASATFPQFADLGSQTIAVSGSGDVAIATLTGGTTVAGPLFGIRHNIPGFPTQTLAAPTGTSPPTVITTGSGGSRTFWTTATTGKDLGTYATSVAGLGAEGTIIASTPTGAKWVVCNTTATALVCPCGTGGHSASSAIVLSKIASRIYVKPQQTHGTPLVLLASTPADGYTFNNDFIYAAMHQVDMAAAATADGTKWCTPMMVALATDGTVATSSAVQGWGKMTKCTW